MIENVHLLHNYLVCNTLAFSAELTPDHRLDGTNISLPTASSSLAKSPSAPSSLHQQQREMARMEQPSSSGVGLSSRSELLFHTFLCRSGRLAWSNARSAIVRRRQG